MRKNAIVSAIESHGTIVAQGPLSSFTPAAGKGTLKFDISPQNKALAHFCIKRCNDFARARGLPMIDEYLATVDLFAAHSNDHPIDFQAMFACPDVGDVMQFISGVGLRVSRSTGLLAGGWRGKFHVRTS